VHAHGLLVALCVAARTVRSPSNGIPRMQVATRFQWTCATAIKLWLSASRGTPCATRKSFTASVKATLSLQIVTGATHVGSKAADAAAAAAGALPPPQVQQASFAVFPPTPFQPP